MAPAAPASSAVDCAAADLFSDCFANCSGTISPEDPGPVCGWSVPDFTTSQGDAVLSAGSMLLELPDNNDPIHVLKSIPTPLASVFGMTAQIFFTESPASADYIFLFINTGNTEQLYLQFEPSGYVLVEVGPSANQAFYEGAWNPNLGSARKIAVAVDALGVPTLFVDDVSVPLAFTSSAGGREGFPGDIVMVTLQNETPDPNSMSVQKIFLASGSQADVNFCCPG